jgi:uncharacterized membrane protein SirB2
MIKIIHILFIFTSFASFVIRFGLSQLNPKILNNKILKIAPHIIDTILLLSGIALVAQGEWLEREYAWVESKIILLICYIIFGIVAMRLSGFIRWLAFSCAITSYCFIFNIAITKNSFIF